MKIGILNACTPQEEIEFESDEFANFVDFFNLTKHDFEFVHYRVTEGELPAMGACDAYLITGSPKGAYDQDAWIAQLGEFVRATYRQQTKIIGVCFGHQLVAAALGGNAEKSEKGWGLGLQPLQFSQQRVWMTPPLSAGAFHFCHQDQVTKLPAAAELLAGQEFCPNGMFVIDDHVLGLQAHPEMTRAVVASAIEWVRRDMPDVPVATLEQAVESLKNGSADNSIMAQWFVNFFNQ